MNLHQTSFSQFVGVDPVSVLPMFSPLLVLINHLSDFLEEDTLLLELSTIIAEKEVRHVGEGWLLFHRQGRKENYQ
jgi:hypothetical protein